MKKTSETDGTGRIGSAFERLRRDGRKALITYIMAGAPSEAETLELISLLEQNGSDIIELGVPFSDPVADGPVIQRAAEAALAQGTTLRTTLKLVQQARKATQVPIVLMTYFNPVFRYGVKAFCLDAADAGVDGVIVPDLPPHEAGELVSAARPAGLDTIFLFAPTSTPERIRLVAKSSTGFIYYVSIAGITGARLELDAKASRSVSLARRASRGLPVALGFGVSSPDEAATVAGFADAVIVGSAIVRRTGGVERAGLGQYVASLRRAIDSERRLA